MKINDNQLFHVQNVACKSSYYNVMTENILRDI